MSKRKCIQIKILNRIITIHYVDTGNGINVLIEGGDLPHIGATAIAVPGKETVILEFPGHKEGIICKTWAESLVNKVNKPIVVSAGIHYDQIDKSDICYILQQLNILLEHMEITRDE